MMRVRSGGKGRAGRGLVPVHARLRPSAPFALLVGLLLAAACAPAGRSLRPDAQPPGPNPAASGPSEPAAPDLDPLVEEAVARSEEAFLAGMRALDAGDLPAAQHHFDDARTALLQADPRVRTDDRLLSAARDLDENLRDLEPRLAGETGGPEGEEPDDLGTPADSLGEVRSDLSAEEADRERARVESAGSEVTYDIPMVVNPQVLAFVDLYQGRWRKLFQGAYSRSGRYLEMVQRVFAEEGLPQDLAYIAHVESGFKPRALSRVRAYGMWQFMAATGKNYGLERTNWVDERADPEKATRAAARYLSFLHGMFGDWHLAMAAYNAGEYKVERAIQATGSRDFWEIARTRHLRPETKNFVPAILAAILVYKSPEKYGFDPSTREAPLSFDRVTVPGPTDMRVIADRAGIDFTTLKDLNPELRRNTTPPADYSLRVPGGAGEGTAVALASLPPSQRLRHEEHVVRKGDTLGAIARRYGCSVDSIQAANGIRDPRELRVGTTLTIPISDSGQEVARAPRRTASPAAASSGGTYTVRPGDTASSIARNHRVSLEDLLAWNGLRESSILHPGQRLEIRPGTAVGAPATDQVAAADPGRTTVYVVKKGDTLYEISRAHDVEVDDLCRWNGISRRKVIRAGDQLKIVMR